MTSSANSNRRARANEGLNHFENFRRSSLNQPNTTVNCVASGVVSSADETRNFVPSREISWTDITEGGRE